MKLANELVAASLCEHMPSYTDLFIGSRVMLVAGLDSDHNFFYSKTVLSQVTSCCLCNEGITDDYLQSKV